MGLGQTFSEMFLILLIVAAFFGTTKMPGVGNLFTRFLRGADPTRPPLPAKAKPWTTVDWLLLSTTLALATTLALTVARSG